MTRDQLLTTAQVIASVFTPSMIRQMHATPDGAEILRQIVRDGLEGADKIVNSLWVDL